ncbi:MAG TPA: hypothetical protein V6C57_06905 [Coleofasciculaceae cyanobacterium]
MLNPVDSDETALQTSESDVDESASEAIAWLHSPKQPRGFAWALIWLMTLVSLGLHGLLMLLPVPSEQPPPVAKPEEKKVRITQLPTLNRPAPPRGAAARPTPKPVVPVRRAASAIPRPVQRAAMPSVQPAVPVVSPSPQQVPAETPTDANPWQDFPQYPGAQPGCYNLPSCMQTSQALSEVGNYFERELAAKKYRASPQITESDRQVYQVSRNNLTQFLSLISVPHQGTVYVLAEAPRSLADLAQAVEVPAAIYDVLSGLAATDATRADFAQPDAFYTGNTVRPEIGITKLVTGETPDTFFDTYFRTNLFNSGFESLEPSQYGGGFLYEVKKDSLSLYINLVPTQDGSGTIVVIWKQPPQ